MSSIGKNKAIEVCIAGSSLGMNADNNNPVVINGTSYAWQWAAYLKQHHTILP